MTFIRAWCDDCDHDVSLGPSAFQVRHELSCDTWTFSFRCSCCAARIVHVTSERIARLLTDVDVMLVEWRLPARGPRLGMRITAEDVDRFVRDFADWDAHGSYR